MWSTYPSCDLWRIDHLSIWQMHRLLVLGVDDVRSHEGEDEWAEPKCTQHNSSYNTFLSFPPFPAGHQRGKVAEASSNQFNGPDHEEFFECVSQGDSIQSWYHDGCSNEDHYSRVGTFRQEVGSQRIHYHQYCWHKWYDVNRVAEVDIMLTSSILASVVVVVRQNVRRYVAPQVGHAVHLKITGENRFEKLTRCSENPATRIKAWFCPLVNVVYGIQIYIIEV